MKYADHKEHIMMMTIVVAIDAFTAIPFAYLRYLKKPVRFATLKLAYIFFNIFFNLFFLVVCPWMYKEYPDFILSKCYHPDIGIGYIFLANLLSTLVVLMLLIPSTMKGLKFRFDPILLKRILKYSFPLLILGIAGVINQTVAQLTYPYLFDSETVAFNQLGIYNACIKITVIITVFTQAFRYAYEPFFFGKSKDKNSMKTYADAMKYFIIFALLVFLAVVFYLDILKHIVSGNYTEGIVVVPIAMLGEIFFGIYFNLSVWYKLTDKTKYGAYFSILGCIIQVAMNIFFVPILGYVASAWATLACNLIIMTISYFTGQKYFPIKYDLKKIFFYFVLAAIFYAAAMYPQIDNEMVRMAYRTVLLMVFAAVIIRKDVPMSEIPVLRKYMKNK
jgi:O-antigen/teichoic acid export membrane protein